MFKVIVSDTEQYDVRFRYEDMVLVQNGPNQRLWVSRKTREESAHRVTTPTPFLAIGKGVICHIARIQLDIPKGKERYKLISSGRSTCDTRDQYDKALGRKQAFAAAVKQNADYSVRRKFWAAYSANISSMKHLAERMAVTS